MKGIIFLILSNFYNKNLPIIIVFIQSDNQDEANKMISYIKIEIESIKNDGNENSIKILKVLAEDKVTDNGIIKAFGISNLMKERSEVVILELNHLVLNH